MTPKEWAFSKWSAGQTLPMAYFFLLFLYAGKARIYNDTTREEDWGGGGFGGKEEEEGEEGDWC